MQSAVQEITGSSDVPLSTFSARYGACAATGPAHASSCDESICTQASTSGLSGAAKPHAQRHCARPSINAMPSHVYQAADAAPPSLRRGAPLHPPAPASSGGNRYSHASGGAPREAQPSMQEQVPGRYQSTRMRSEERRDMQYSHRPATAQPDVFSTGHRYIGGSGSLSRDASPARLQHSRSDKPLMRSPAAPGSPMARLTDTGEMRHHSNGSYTLRRPATAAGDSSPSRTSAGLEPSYRIASPVARVPSLTGRKLGTLQGS